MTNIKSYLSTVYDEKSHPYTKYPYQLTRYFFNVFGMKKGLKIIDIGCGRGEFSFNFKELGLEVYGVDKDKYINQSHLNVLDGIEVKLDLLNGIEVKYTDIEKDLIPFADNTFDFVFCKSVIEHMHDPSHLFEEMYRILKKDGTVIIMTPDWISNMKIYYDDFTHRTPFTVTSMKDALKMFGFKNVETELFYQLPVIWMYPILKIVSTIIRNIVPITYATKLNKNEFEKFIRWSCELQILASGQKIWQT